MSTLTEFLPTEYQKQDVCKWIWEYLDNYAADLETSVDDIEREYFTIDTATDGGLNFIARLNGMYVLFWDEGWTIEQRREILSNYEKIMTERGNKDLIQWLFNLFDLEAKLTQSRGWQLGVSTFSVQFAKNIFDYIVQLPSNYSEGTPEYMLVQKIVNTFVPDYIRIAIEVLS